MNRVAYYVVAAIVRNTLAVIIVMIFALDVVELLVSDENPRGFAEQLFEGINRLAQRSVCALGACITDVVNCFIYDIVASIVGYNYSDKIHLGRWQIGEHCCVMYDGNRC